MALILDLPPKLILPDYYQVSRPAIIRPEGSFTRIGLPIEASLPGIAALVWGSNSEAAPGQQVFTADGSFVVPAGVTSISALCVGHGGPGQFGNAGGRGGDLRYAITLAVTPGETLTIGVPAYSGNTTTPVSIKRGGTTLLAAACGYWGSTAAGTSSTTGGNIGGGNGGTGFISGNTTATGAGAAGYSGNGGAGGGGGGAAGGNGAGGGGGGGRIQGAGGGVGLLGEGSNGAGATSGSNGGAGGSGGTGGAAGSDFGAAGGTYGGGAGIGSLSTGVPGAGAVRIIWGAGRAYPSTNTGDV